MDREASDNVIGFDYAHICSYMWPYMAIYVGIYGHIRPYMVIYMTICVHIGDIYAHI